MLSNRLAIRLLIALALGLGFAVVAQASTPFFTQHKVAARGELAPRAGGATFRFFPDQLWVNDAGTVVFEAELMGGAVDDGLFRWHAGALEALVLPGDPAPASIGGSFANPRGGSLNAAGAFAFLAYVDGGRFGLFRMDAGVATPIGLTGDPLPEAPESAFNWFSCPSLNDSGAVAFIGSSELGEAIYVHAAGVTTRVIGPHDPMPGDRELISINCVDLDDGGEILFGAGVSGPGTSEGEGLFVVSGGEVTQVAFTGDPAPGTGGGTFDSFDYATPDLAAGEIVFHALVAGGDTPIGLFRSQGGVHSPLALIGHPAPSVIGGVYDYLDTRPRVNESGDLAFRAVSQAGGVFNYALFLVRDEVPRAVALTGDPAPGTGGGVHGIFHDGIAVSSHGAVAFVNSISFGTTQRAVFLATPPPQSVPGLGPEGWLALASALFASGGLTARARRATARSTTAR